ncbi:uncharacterized protein MIR1-1HG [Nomascus leucogenys]|uniref:uncharacterized protein MIR1-1HG n=1 Tax=Nomascus leucogenys TaxID=61853 RepID=UPI00122D984A|nr:uncharacterized protein MIR1-1HG [Nomascus leucogenys]
MAAACLGCLAGYIRTAKVRPAPDPRGAPTRALASQCGRIELRPPPLHSRLAPGGGWLVLPPLQHLLGSRDPAPAAAAAVTSPAPGVPWAPRLRRLGSRPPSGRPLRRSRPPSGNLESSKHRLSCSHLQREVLSPPSWIWGPGRQPSPGTCPGNHQLPSCSCALMAPCGPAAGPAAMERTQQAVRGEPGSARGQLQVSPEMSITHKEKENARLKEILFDNAEAFSQPQPHSAPVSEGRQLTGKFSTSVLTKAGGDACPCSWECLLRCAAATAEGTPPGTCATNGP